MARELHSVDYTMSATSRCSFSPRCSLCTSPSVQNVSPFDVLFDRRRLCLLRRLRPVCPLTYTRSSGNAIPASFRILTTAAPTSNWHSCEEWSQQGLYFRGRYQSYQCSPITALKFRTGPRSNGFSPGLLWRMANVLMASGDVG